MKELGVKSLKIIKIGPEQSMLSSHFFNSSKFLLNKQLDIIGWQLLKEECPIAQIFFYISNGIAISGFQSTFGSFDIEDNISIEELESFIEAIIADFKNEGIAKIKIKQYPSYFVHSSLVENCLKSCGFENVVTETNQHIIIDKPQFEDVADRSEVIRSNKCKKLGYEFKISSLLHLPDIYALLIETLERNGNRPSMSYDSLKNVIESCLGNYMLFTLWDDDKLIAATVSIKLEDSIMYNFYHADHLDYRRVSAITYLLKNIYLYCYSNNFKIFDLGTSTVNGVLNEGLFNFKKTRGAISSDKNYYHIKL